MGGVPQVAEAPALIPAADLSSRVVYVPVRHHSPACAWHVGRLIEELKPEAVLVEGPRDATELIPFLVRPETRTPVAIYTTYVERKGRDLPVRHSAYYPLCDYSPELAAIRAAARVGARARFIDLTFPEMVTAERVRRDDKVRSLLDERYFKHSRFLKLACRRIGVRDPDDLWDHLFENDFENREPAAFIRDVLAYCALSRQDYTTEELEGEGTVAREAAMAHAVAAETDRVVVVTGGFHTVALPSTAPAVPAPMDVPRDDAQVVLMRYGFEQLDRLNGYASGMPSPEFYQRRWDRKEPAELIVDIGRRLREERPGTSVADEVAALAQARGLARLRGHPEMSREDLLDGLRSCFIKGSEDIEGVLVLAMARKVLAGERIGDVPPDAGQPPILEDFRRTAARLRIVVDRVDGREIALDLYRKVGHRESSRFFHRLRFLDVPFQQWLRGPDFVSGEGLERVQEVWSYRWTPGVESTLIERSLYGSSLEEAATSLALERFEAQEKSGQGRRADVACGILLDACRMGLHRRTQELLDRTRALVAEDAAFVSLVHALEQLLVLHLSREPLEAHKLRGVTDVASDAYDRCCYLLPGLAATSDAETDASLDALNALQQGAAMLGDTAPRRELRRDRLRELAEMPGGNAALKGAAVGSLFGEGWMDAPETARLLRGHLESARNEGTEGSAFLRGLLRTARTVLWQIPDVLASVHDVLKEWEESRFVKVLPTLRLAFADLTPRETDRVARAVAAAAGAADLAVPQSMEVSGDDVVRGAEVNRRVMDLLKADGLEAFGG